MENDVKKKEEFEELCKPLSKWLLENHHLHTKIIIEPDRAELVEVLTGIPLVIEDPVCRSLNEISRIGSCVQRL